MRFGGRRGATSLPIKTRNTSVTDLMQLSDCTMKLDMRARPGTPVQLNGIHAESRIRREGGPGGSSKRKASPMTDNGTAKVRRLNGSPEEAERDTRSLLSEDQSEKCEKIVAGVNKVQSSQNGRVVNQSESARETAESTAESEEETFAGCCKSLMPTLEGDFQGRLSQNLRNSGSESTANCNSLESASVSAASHSVSKTSSVNPRITPCDVSPSLQPVVVLRKLTPDEIRRSTTERLRQREEELSSEESFLSFSPRRKSYGRGREGHRKCNCRKRKSSTCALPPSGVRCNGQSSEQESPGCGGEGSVCRAVSRLDYTSLARKGMANEPRNEGSSHRSCNGVGGRKFDTIGRCSDEVGSDEGSSNSDISSAETVDFPTAKTTPPYTVIGSHNRKCCSNGMCRVATPELIGLENPVTSNRCWMNVTLQTLFSMENFMQSMIRAFEDVNAEENSLISCILTLHYARSLGHQECVYEQARKLSEVLGKLNSDYILNDQQDPSEFILWLFNVFEPALEKYSPSWASSLITENFRFEMEERTCCMGCMNYVVKISSFLILMLDIYIGTSKIKNIQEALAAYTSTKNIRRTCSLCGEEKSMVKTAFKSVPRYLIINLKRYSVKEGEVIRDETPVRHSNTLGLEKYSVPNTTINCSKDTKSVAVASPSKYNIGRKSLRRAAPGGDYNLIAIIHHSGFSASSGHYVCDVYHASTKKWYSYNDKMVKEICEATLSTTKRLKTGYIYVYQNNNC